MEEKREKYLTKVPLYFWLIVCTLGLHIVYEFIFLYLKNTMMIGYNFFSITVIGLCLKYIQKNQKVITFICFLEATIFIVVATVYMGWDYGFQNWYFAFSILSITVPFSNRKLFRVLGICQVLMYVFLYMAIKLQFQTAKLVSTEMLFVMVNLLFVFCLIYFAEQVLNISKAMELLFLQKEMQEMEAIVRTDELTGLTTRRRMNDVLSNLNSVWDNQQMDFYLIFGDIDNFKQINDHYGHEAGDQVLRQVATILNSELRGDDVISRWGGEEFLILLQSKKQYEKLSRKKAKKILERLRKKISEKPVEYGKEKIYITITFGGVNTEGYKDIYQMIKGADEQMYIGKNKGRNCVIVQ